MNILEQIAAKAEKGDTGMSLHYGFLYSCVIGLESKNVFEFGSGFSTHVILHALEKTGGILTSCDITDYEVNHSITEFTKNSNRWNFYNGNSNEIFEDKARFPFDVTDKLPLLIALLPIVISPFPVVLIVDVSFKLPFPDAEL